MVLDSEARPDPATHPSEYALWCSREEARKWKARLKAEGADVHDGRVVKGPRLTFHRF